MNDLVQVRIHQWTDVRWVAVADNSVADSLRQVVSFIRKPLFICFALLGCGLLMPNNFVKGQTKIINVVDYGANGADELDDSDAFELALSQTKPGQQLFVPAGKYCISRPLLVNVNEVHLKGEGAGSILKFDNSADYYAQYKSRVGLINVVADRVTISELQFDQNFRESGKSDGDAASIGCIIMGGKYLGKPQRTEGITVDNCIFYDYYGDAVSAFNAYTADLTVTNNRFVSSYIVGSWSDSGVKGEQAVSVSSASGVLIQNNIIEGALDDAIAIHNRSENIQILDNNITTTGGRVLLNGTTNGRVAGNEIVYIQDGGCAIYLSYSVNSKNATINEQVIVEDNIIQVNQGVEVQAGIKMFGGGNGVIVRKNKVVGNGGGTGILIQDRKSKADQMSYFAKNVEIIDNQIENCEYGIVVFDSEGRSTSSDIALRDNKISNTREGIVSGQESIESGTIYSDVDVQKGVNAGEAVRNKPTGTTKPSNTESPKSADAQTGERIELDNLSYVADDPPYYVQVFTATKRITFLDVIDEEGVVTKVEVQDVKNKAVMGTITDQGALEIPLKEGRRYRAKIYSASKNIPGLVLIGS